MILLLTGGCAWLGAWLEPEDASSPSVAFVAPESGDAFLESEAIEFVLQVDDGGDNIVWVSVILESDLDGELCNRAPGTTGLVECGGTLSEGIHTLTASARDLGGNVASESIELQVGEPGDSDADSDGPDSDVQPPDQRGFDE